jgi:hypothetical protein
MKYFVKISMEGSFPSGVDDDGTYEIPEAMYNRFISVLAIGVCTGRVKKVWTKLYCGRLDMENR